MNKFILIIVTIFSVSCVSTKRQIKNDTFSSDLLQKIENRDFIVNVEITEGDAYGNGTHTRQRSMHINGDSLISNIGVGHDFVSNFDESGIPSLPPSKKPSQKFIFTIFDYKIKNSHRSGVEITFNYELWSNVENKLILRFYKMVINSEGEVSIYIDNDKNSLSGKIQ